MMGLILLLRVVVALVGTGIVVSVGIGTAISMAIYHAGRYMDEDFK